MAKIEIIYALPDEQKSYYVIFDDTITAKEAILQARMLDLYPELNLENIKVGVYAQEIMLDTELKDGERLEIYRNLTVDPKQARMLRAEQKRKKEGIRLFGA